MLSNHVDWSGIRGLFRGNSVNDLTRGVKHSKRMSRVSAGDDDSPGLEEVLVALHDADCRAIIRELSDPMTAEEISEAADIPLSTTYRKLDRLTEASLLEEGVEVRKDGQHVSRYILVFDEVNITLSDDRELEVEVSGEKQTPEQRLATLWSEVRKET